MGLHNFPMSKHTICHIEFEVADLERAQAFFSAIFEWKFKSFGDDMIVFGVGEDHIGGLVKKTTPRVARCAVVWFDVEDIESTLAAAVTAGGQSDGVKQPVPHVGWSGTFTDPDGNPIGVVQFDRVGS
jgi:predicted enzyme related to lactoylglutathione lyase